MIQVKTFRGLEHEHEELTEQLNTWIRENNIRVVSVDLNLAPQSKLPDSVLRSGTSSDVMMLVTYEVD
jgi:hypothetical protein